MAASTGDIRAIMRIGRDFAAIPATLVPIGTVASTADGDRYCSGVDGRRRTTPRHLPGPRTARKISIEAAAAHEVPLSGEAPVSPAG
ncbi:hypothetical protein QE392_003219 [Microbacterium proteolyticum]|nr:hypothetical protein [Microbacterium proteolyticum]